MNRKLSLFAAILTVLHLTVRAEDNSSATKPLSLTSPNGKVEVRLISPDSNQAAAQEEDRFEVSFAGKKLFSGKLAICVQGTNLLEDAVMKSSHVRESDSTYAMPLGKNNPVRDHFKELTLNFATDRGPIATFQVVFRAYDDGVAYRYVFPEQKNTSAIEITDEPGTFQFIGDPQMWPLYRENYTTSHEGIYEPSRFSALKTNRLIDVPLLARFDDGTSVSITQASLRNYAGLYLKTEAKGTDRWLQCDLPPLPEEQTVKVKSRLPLSSPWRVALIGTAPGRLIESDLLMNLNEPNAIGDTSWLKPGKTTFYWWNGFQEPPDVQEAVKWEKGYIDFCATNGITYHAVIGTDENHPWYSQSKNGYNPPGPDADVTKPREGFPMGEICDYAKSKGVAIRVWVHWKPLSKHLEEAFTQYEKWGISGLMVDFLDRNDQEMVLFTEKVLQSAARHHLNIQFHGVWAPTGLKRTYPNLFNHEGVLNLEYLKWTDRCTPEHDLTVPFTRMVAGPMDYHLGGFRASRRDMFHHRSVQPVIYGTRCLMLAMYVVYDNPMPMIADTPDDYVNQPGFDFLREVPTTWDETRVLSGEVGKYIVVARRKGTDWYVGAMTDWTARKLKVPLDFLPSGQYKVEIWGDDLGSPNPNRLLHAIRTMNSTNTMELNLASGGGEVFHAAPDKE